MLTLQMNKQKSKNKSIYSFARNSLLLVISVALLFGAISGPIVRADQFDEQIKQLNQDSSTKRAVKSQLGVEAASLSDTIGKLQAQINTLENQIQQNQNKRDDLQRQIEAAEAELTKQKNVLGEVIRQMYIDGDISTLEMLASSKD
jgi:peptidoglycan hydrolase CwlO-like protein